MHVVAGCRDEMASAATAAEYKQAMQNHMNLFISSVLELPGISAYMSSASSRAVLSRATLAYVLQYVVDTTTATKGEPRTYIPPLMAIFLQTIPASASPSTQPVFNSEIASVLAKAPELVAGGIVDDYRGIVSGIGTVYADKPKTSSESMTVPETVRYKGLVEAWNNERGKTSMLDRLPDTIRHYSDGEVGLDFSELFSAQGDKVSLDTNKAMALRVEGDTATTRFLQSILPESSTYGDMARKYQAGLISNSVTQNRPVFRQWAALEALTIAYSGNTTRRRSTTLASLAPTRAALYAVASAGGRRVAEAVRLGRYGEIDTIYMKAEEMQKRRDRLEVLLVANGEPQHFASELFALDNQVVAGALVSAITRARDAMGEANYKIAPFNHLLLDDHVLHSVAYYAAAHLLEGVSQQPRMAGSTYRTVALGRVVLAYEDMKSAIARAPPGWAAIAPQPIVAPFAAAGDTPVYLGALPISARFRKDAAPLDSLRDAASGGGGGDAVSVMPQLPVGVVFHWDPKAKGATSFMQPMIVRAGIFVSHILDILSDEDQFHYTVAIDSYMRACIKYGLSDNLAANTWLTWLKVRAIPLTPPPFLGEPPLVDGTAMENWRASLPWMPTPLLKTGSPELHTASYDKKEIDLISNLPETVTMRTEIAELQAKKQGIAGSYGYLVEANRAKDMDIKDAEMEKIKGAYDVAMDTLRTVGSVGDLLRKKVAVGDLLAQQATYNKTAEQTMFVANFVAWVKSSSLIFASQIMTTRPLAQPAQSTTTPEITKAIEYYDAAVTAAIYSTLGLEMLYHTSGHDLALFATLTLASQAMWKKGVRVDFRDTHRNGKPSATMRVNSNPGRIPPDKELVGSELDVFVELGYHLFRSQQHANTPSGTSIEAIRGENRRADGLGEMLAYMVDPSYPQVAHAAAAAVVRPGHRLGYFTV
jgi:hypothetical protein